MAFLDFLAPPAHKPLLPQERIDKEYSAMRWKVFLGIYFGYAAYYLVRKNLSFAVPDMIEEGLIDKAGAGVAMAGIPIAYAVSKFIMGSVSDRSDARKFMSIGLVLASLVMLAVGLLPFSAGNISTTVSVLFAFMLLAGWLSGMGWPPCGRILAHWFSQNERSFKMSVWNTAHNVGNGTLALLVSAGVFIFASMGIGESWRAAFIFPALVALCFAGFCWWTLRDTPESCGLPAIEDYRHDYTGAKASKGEEEKIPFRRLFVDYVFKNKMLWLIAAANVFVYFVRYGISDWSPTYLQQVCQMSKEESSLAFALFEYAGIPGTILDFLAVLSGQMRTCQCHIYGCGRTRHRYVLGRGGNRRNDGHIAQIHRLYRTVDYRWCRLRTYRHDWHSGTLARAKECGRNGCGFHGLVRLSVRRCGTLQNRNGLRCKQRARLELHLPNVPIHLPARRRHLYGSMGQGETHYGGAYPSGGGRT